MISIQIQEESYIPLMSLEGRLDTTTSSEVDQALRPILEKQKFLIIDLSRCSYLSSAGIRILLLDSCLMGTCRYCDEADY